MCDKGSVLVNCELKCTTEISSFVHVLIQALNSSMALFVDSDTSATENFAALAMLAAPCDGPSLSFAYRVTEFFAFYASLAMHKDDSDAGVAETFLAMLAMPQVFITPQA